MIKKINKENKKGDFFYNLHQQYYIYISNYISQKSISKFQMYYYYYYDYYFNCYYYYFYYYY